MGCAILELMTHAGVTILTVWQCLVVSIEFSVLTPSGEPYKTENDACPFQLRKTEFEYLSYYREAEDASC